MAVRLGQGLNIGGMMSGNAAAADLLVEAGRAKGAGLAAIGQGLGQGLATFGANRRADKVRAEENAFRQQSREDMLAERAADNARQDAAFAMRQDEWKISVLTANRDRAMQEAQFLAAAAQDVGDPGIVERAKAAASEAERFGTALDALLSSRMGVQGAGSARRGGVDTGGVRVNGKSMSEMTDAELNDLMDKSARGEVDYSYRGGATGDMGQGVGGVSSPRPATASSNVVNDGGVMSGDVAPTPMPVAAAPAAPAVPQMDPRDPLFIKVQATQKIQDINKTFEKYKGKVDSNGNPIMSAKRSNELERARLEAMQLVSYADAQLDQRKMAMDVQKVREEAAARRGVDVASDEAERARINEGRAARGLPPVASLREVGPQMTTERTVDNREDTQKHQKEMAQIRNTYSLGRMAQSEETKKRLIAYAASVGKADDPRFKMLATMRDDANSSARSLYAAADNDSLNKAASQALMDRADAEMARVKEFDKQIAMVFGDVAARVAPAAGAAPQAAASVEFPSWITEDFKERWKAMPQSERDKAIKARGK